MLHLQTAECIYGNPFSGDVERTESATPGPSCTPDIPHYSGRDFCTALTPVCLRLNLVHCKQLQHAHAELPGTDREWGLEWIKPHNSVHMEHNWKGLNLEVPMLPVELYIPAVLPGSSLCQLGGGNHTGSQHGCFFWRSLLFLWSSANSRAASWAGIWPQACSCTKYLGFLCIPQAFHTLPAPREAVQLVQVGLHKINLFPEHTPVINTEIKLKMCL